MVKNFTDFDVWKEAHQLSILVYLHTIPFPKEEQLGLSLQIRQTSVRVSSLIAEGFSSTNAQATMQLYATSDSILYELKAQLLLAKDLQFLDPKIFNVIAKQSNITHNALQKLPHTSKPTYKHQGAKIQ